MVPNGLTDRATIPGLLARIDALKEATGLSDGRISRLIFGSGDQVDRLRDGRTITVDRLARGHAALEALAAERNAPFPRNSPGRTAPGEPATARRRHSNARAK